MMKNPLATNFTSGKIKGMSGGSSSMSGGKSAMPKGSPMGKKSAMKANMASKSGQSGK